MDLINDSFYEENSFRASLDSFDDALTLRRQNSGLIDIISQQLSQNINPKNQILPRIQSEDVINQDELKNLLDELKCPICLNIIEDPRTCIKCEYNFCYSCIKEWDNQERRKKCPCCRDQGQESYLFQRDRERNEHRQFHQSILPFNAKYTNCPRVFKKILNTILIICHNVGCNGVVKFDERQIHLKSCLYQPFNCPNKGCTEQVTKLSENEHIKVCEYRMEECKYCFRKYNIKSMDTHEDFCEENKKKCLDCEQDIQVYLMHEHEKNCQYKEIKCEICENIFYRFDFEYHTEAKCYEILYKNSLETIKKKDKEVLNKDKQLLEKEKQMNQISSMIQNLKLQLSSEVEMNIIQFQIEEIIQISNKVSEKNNQKFEDDEELEEQKENQMDTTVRRGKRKIKNNSLNESDIFKAKRPNIPAWLLNEDEEEEKEEIQTNKIDQDFKSIKCKQIDVKYQQTNIFTNLLHNSLKIESFKHLDDDDLDDDELTPESQIFLAKNYNSDFDEFGQAVICEEQLLI